MDQPLHHSDAKGVFWHNGFKTNKFQMKKKFNHFYLSLLGGALLTLGACSKNDNDNITPQKPLPDYVGLFVLNEGTSLNSNLGFVGFGSNNYGVYDDNSFKGSIGKGGNDLIRYGSKIYVTATDANKIIVIESETKEELETIQITSPRFLLPYNGKVYATNGDNQLTVIDTSTYSTSAIEVGRSPEQLAATNGKIYVANSGWRDVQAGGSYDNRISVINPSSFTVEGSITVANNISTISADTVKNMLYVNASAIYEGNNISVPSRLYVVNTANDDVKQLKFGAEQIELVFQDNIGRAYMISSNYTEGKNTCLIMDLSSQQTQAFGTSNLTQPYGITYVPELPSIVVGDAKDHSNKGTLNLFTLNGQANGSVEVGVSPKKFVFSIGQKEIANLLK